MEEGRISADEAYKRVSKDRPFRAAEAICARAHDGILTSYARVFICDEDRREDCQIPAGFWWARGQAALEQNWTSGDFETWIDKRHHCRAYGVTFNEYELDQMLPSRTESLRAERVAGQGYALASSARAELVKSASCTEREAEAEILRRCRTGLIHARCQTLSIDISDESDSRFAEQEEVGVPNWFWEKCLSSADTVLDWSANTFAGKGFVNGQALRARLRGVEFHVSDIVGMENSLRKYVAGIEGPNVPSDNAAERKSAGGRKMTQKWVDWVAELADYIHHEGIPEGQGSDGMDAMIAAIDQRLINRNLEGPGRTTVQPAVRSILIRLRSAGN